jgi:peptidoglycan/LPS O-acetylase OafA/YrhL
MNRRVAVAVVVGVFGAVLGVAGAGHVYLRRWRRAAAWFSGVLGVSLGLVLLFTDPRTVTADTLPPTVAGPVVALLLVSVVDAYLVGRRAASSTGSDDDGPSCPACGRSVDPALDFCWYCSASLEEEPTSR